MKKIISLSFLAVLFFSSQALAEGPYLGVGFDYNNPLSSDINALDPGLGLDLRFGYDFGPVALEADLMGSRHNNSNPGYDSADFGGFSIDMRAFLSQLNDPNQFYFLFGIGSYSLSEFNPYYGVDTELTGGGWNFGVGMERFLNSHMALNFAAIYRIIRYDEISAGGATYPQIPEINGDTFTLQASFNYYF